MGGGGEDLAGQAGKARKEQTALSRPVRQTGLCPGLCFGSLPPLSCSLAALLCGARPEAAGRLSGLTIKQTQGQKRSKYLQVIWGISFQVPVLYEDP